MKRTMRRHKPIRSGPRLKAYQRVASFNGFRGNEFELIYPPIYLMEMRAGVQRRNRKVEYETVKRRKPT